MVITVILGVLTTLSLVIMLWQFLVAYRFPLHRRHSPAPSLPPVSILKPLKGCDSETEACLTSWFQQVYPSPVQILFGVSTDQDPVCGLVRKLIADFPGVDAQLLVCPALTMPNRKVAKLSHLLLEAKHETLVISDADVSVPSDFLEQTVSHLRREGAALVNCFYRLASPPISSVRWEGVAVNADFWSQVLQANSLGPLDFALGAAIVTTRSQIRAIGGFAAVGDYLADDYELGHRITRSGGKVVLSPLVVECRETAKGWFQTWNHQLRWARTVRFCKPWPYFFSILSNGTLWPLLLLLWGNLGSVGVTLAPAALLPQGYAMPTIFVNSALMIFAACLIFRFSTALTLQGRMTGSRDHLAWWWLIPIKDLLQVLIWASAFLGNEVVWGGERLRVTAEGRLRGRPVEKIPENHSACGPQGNVPRPSSGILTSSQN